MVSFISKANGYSLKKKQFLDESDSCFISHHTKRQAAGLYDPDLVGDVKSVVVGGQLDVGLLLTVGPGTFKVNLLARTLIESSPFAPMLLSLPA